jgi:hypothetical protein
MNAQPLIDFSQISFPSDKLTIAALRKAYPNSFDLPARMPSSKYEEPTEYGRGSLEQTLGGVIDAERLVASLAFKESLGLALTESEALRPREVIHDSLTSEYITLGLASGEHHANQLVRDIETQATSQALAHPGNPR